MKNTWEDEKPSKLESNQEMPAPSMEEIAEPEEEVLRAWEEFREKLPPEDCPYWED